MPKIDIKVVMPLYKKIIETKLNNKDDYKNKWIKLENNGFLKTGKQISKIIDTEYCEKIQKPDIVHIVIIKNYVL